MAERPVSVPARVGLSVLAGLGGLGLLVAAVYMLGGANAQAHGPSFAVAIWIGVAVLPLYAVAIVLIRRRPGHPEARWLLVMASAAALGVGVERVVQEAYLVSGDGGWVWAANLGYQWVGLVGLVAAATMIAYFPDGVPGRRWHAVTLRAMWGVLALPVLVLLASPWVTVDPLLLSAAPPVPSPIAVPGLEPLAAPLQAAYGVAYALSVVAVLILLLRYRAADANQRRPMRWLLVPVLAGILIVLIGLALIAAGLSEQAVYGVIGFLYVPIPLLIAVAFVVGVLRYRLFDFDLVVRRSVVYGALTLGIAGLYALVAAAPGLALGRTIPVELAVLLTIVTAFAFHPLRRRLQALADRFAFGDRVNSYELLTELGATLEQAVDLDELLPRLAATVRRGLGARWVRVSLRDADGGGWLPDPVGLAGVPDGDSELRVPLARGAEPLGQIECGGRESGAYSARDATLLATLAGQAASAIANVRLAAQLARSRARIVAAGDAERRRIERDIHDGVQQQVVALLTTIRLARNRIGRQEVSPDEVLAELAGDAGELLTDLRDLAHGIHPPVLSDRGLVAAVEARTARLPLKVTVRAQPELRSDRLAPDLEGASYFVMCEAITNVVKHAEASRGEITMSTANGHLAVDVRDDGAGFTPGKVNGGTGLINIRDRVEALGGRLLVRSAPGEGTEVHAELPLGASGA